MNSCYCVWLILRITHINHANALLRLYAIVKTLVHANKSTDMRRNDYFLITAAMRSAQCHRKLAT